MSSDVSQSKQAFFKPITLQSEKSALFKSMLLAHCPLQLKPEASPSLKGANDLTLVQVAERDGEAITAHYVSGPKLPPGEVTVVFELAKSMLFCTATLKDTAFGKYVMIFKKIFELQRRDAYRVTIAENQILARFKVSKAAGLDFPKEFKVADLSAGGLGLIIREDDAAVLAVGTPFSGKLKIGTHDPLELTAIVKHHRKVTLNKENHLHVGCAFTEMTVALNQKIAFLVNDCHRQSFSRILK